jgi:peptide deformylase
MTIYNLVKESDDILKQVSSDWDWDKDGEIAEFAQSMLKLMFEKNGLGLAAPQIGVNKRV